MKQTHFRLKQHAVMTQSIGAMCKQDCFCNMGNQTLECTFKIKCCNTVVRVKDTVSLLGGEKNENLSKSSTEK